MLISDNDSNNQDQSVSQEDCNTKKECQPPIDFDSKEGMLEWLELCNRPPLPVSAEQALLNNKAPKQPGYYKSKTFFEAVKWETVQGWHKLSPSIKKGLIQKWHADSRIEGLGTLMGFDGKNYWISLDFDLKDFDDEDILKDTIERWQSEYPVVKEAPSFQTQGGGLRYLFRSPQPIKDWSSHSHFTLEPDSTQKMGQLLNKNGGFTVLPPSIGETGNEYLWLNEPDPAKDYLPPLVNTPEEIGIYRVVKPQQQKQSVKRSEIQQAGVKSSVKLNNSLPRINKSNVVPLTVVVAPEHRELLKSGVEEGERNSTLFKLAADLYGAANKLDEMGQLYEGSPEALLNEFARKCNPPIEDEELDRTIESAKSNNPQPCLDEEKMVNCIKAFNKQPVGQVELDPEEQPEYQQKKKEKRPDPNLVARMLAEKYEKKWAYCSQLGGWLVYELERSGVWSLADSDYIQYIIDRELRAVEIFEYSSARYLTDIEKLIKTKLYLRKWKEKPQHQWMPFNNGILNLDNDEFKPHSPDNYLTWCLSRDYNPLDKDWQMINDWLDQLTGGNGREKKLLIYFCAACLKGLSNLQKFLLTTGFGGTGKGVFANLVTALIGEENTAAIGFEDLQDKHERFTLFGKRLVIMPDQDKFSNRLGQFKNLTGGDPIRARDLFKSSMQFVFKGLVLISSNQPVVNTAQSWFKRRLLLANFNRVPKEPDPGFLDKLKKGLSGFTNYLLTIPVGEIKEFITQGSNKRSSAEVWDNMRDSDSLAAWVNDHIIFDPEAKTPTGDNANEWKDCTPNQISSLYGHYNYFCSKTNRKALGLQNFSRTLEEICTQTLKENVSRQRIYVDEKRCRGFIGVRIRRVLDPHPTIDELLEKTENKVVQVVPSPELRDLEVVPEAVPGRPQAVQSNECTQHQLEIQNISTEIREDATSEINKQENKQVAEAPPQLDNLKPSRDNLGDDPQTTVYQERDSLDNLPAETSELENQDSSDSPAAPIKDVVLVEVDKPSAVFPERVITLANLPQVFRAAFKQFYQEYSLREQEALTAADEVKPITEFNVSVVEEIGERIGAFISQHEEATWMSAKADSWQQAQENLIQVLGWCWEEAGDKLRRVVDVKAWREQITDAVIEQIGGIGLVPVDLSEPY